MTSYIEEGSPGDPPGTQETQLVVVSPDTPG